MADKESDCLSLGSLRGLEPVLVRDKLGSATVTHTPSTQGLDTTMTHVLLPCCSLAWLSSER